MEPETFLRAAVQGKIHVIEKFLADGGSPDTCDEVARGAPVCFGSRWRARGGGHGQPATRHLAPQFHRTALHRSSLEGHTDVLQKLLDSGATVDFRDRVSLWARGGGGRGLSRGWGGHGVTVSPPR